MAAGYPKTTPYVYAGLAAAAYHEDPLNFLRENYQTSIETEVRVKAKDTAEGWNFVLFENTANNTLIVAFRGTDLSKQPTDVLYDLFNEMDSLSSNPIIHRMSVTVSKWLDLYNSRHEYDEVSFVGHSEGGLYARFVLNGDERIKFRVTFNTAKPENVYNLRSKDDPISMITGFVWREKKIWFKRQIPINAVWTICDGLHGIHWFEPALLDKNQRRKTWKEVEALRRKFDQQLIGESVAERWFELGKESEHQTLHWWKHSFLKRNLKMCIVSFVILASSFMLYRRRNSA